MPRARKGNALRKGGQRRGGGARSCTQADSGSSEDDAASEARSTTSECPSLLSTAAEDCLGGEAVDEQSQQENLEEKLKDYVDCLTDKSAKTRQGALESLRVALASRLLPDFLLERSLTLADALEKCLKKGKGEEQALAAAVLGLLCVQLGPGPKGEELFHSLQPLLISVLSDSTASPTARLHVSISVPRRWSLIPEQGVGFSVFRFSTQYDVPGVDPRWPSFVLFPTVCFCSWLGLLCGCHRCPGPGLLLGLLGRCFQLVLWHRRLCCFSGSCQPTWPALCHPAGLGIAAHHLP